MLQPLGWSTCECYSLWGGVPVSATAWGGAGVVPWGGGLPLAIPVCMPPTLSAITRIPWERGEILL